MVLQEISLIAAGVIGAATATIHGVLMQRFMVAPIGHELAEHGRTSAPLLRLLPVLMHFSTFAWFASGAGLVIVAIAGTRDMQVAVSMGVGALYAFGVAGNAWATRGQHPGWVLLLLACLLIVAGLT